MTRVLKIAAEVTRKAFEAHFFRLLRFEFSCTRHILATAVILFCLSGPVFSSDSVRKMLLYNYFSIIRDKIQRNNFCFRDDWLQLSLTRTFLSFLSTFQSKTAIECAQFSFFRTDPHGRH